MLNNLSDSFNGMGNAYNFVPDFIRNISRPELDMSDPKSMAAYANWNIRNGNPEEAAKYNALAIEQGQVAQQRKAKGELAQMQTAMMQLEQERQNALGSLTVPGGGPPSDAQIAEVNRNFAQAAQRLGGRIGQTASGIDGATGMEGAEALNKYKKAQNFKTILTNTGNSEWAPVADQLSAEDVQNILSGNIGGVSAPSAVREYKYFESLDEEQQGDYLRVKRASQLVDLGGGGTGAVSALDPTSVTTVVSSEDATSADAQSAAAQRTAEDEAAAGSQAAQEAKVIINAVDENIAIYNDAIAALDEGGRSGTFANMFPTFKDATLKLQQAIKRRGLEVIQNTTFGSLSAPEMQLALSSEIDGNLSEPELRKELQKKIRAQEELRREMNRFISWRYNTVMVGDRATQPNLNKSPAQYQLEVYGAESPEAPLPKEPTIKENEDSFDIDLTTGLGG
jgi:hypothetical protein